VIEQEKDPVCGASVNPSSGVHESVGSNVYTFCSDECRAKFVVNPGRYLA